MRVEEAGWLKQILTGSTDNKDFAPCDFIIEAVFEEMEIKRKLFTELETIISPECILASNTSSLSVTNMSDHLKNPERTV